ncbi:helix-turn-helix transcriptional regulator [Dactylosporangium sp. CS-033363]|uniref:helix-turn-helix transcriptional regulator n=1 Tax=Dactylosporangium sp. CS-033363 TaxID=3239935 RepID=UPI003D8D1EE9
MTRPTARVLALLEVLQRGGTRTAAELAGLLGVDERTIRRYVEHLVDLEVPVRTVRGRHGGFRLAPGYRMPPLMLTGEEALAVLLGLLASRRSGLTAAPAAATESAAAKVRRVLPRPIGERLDAVLSTLDFTAPARTAATPETGVLLTLAEAARDRHPVELTYAGRNTPAGNGGGELGAGPGVRTTVRTVHPYGIVAHSGRWYLTAADAAHGEVRTFRLDRIRSVTALPGTFTAPADFDPAAEVLSGIAHAPYRHAVSVVFAATADEVRRRLRVAVVEELTGGQVRASFRAASLDWVPGALAAVNRPFAIESPEALRVEVRALAARLSEYSG